MFHRKPLRATPVKHVVYVAFATLLGIFLSLLAHAAIEMVYLRAADRAGHIVVWYGGCALHPALQIGLVVAGGVGGFFLGRYWWRMLYVQHKW